MKRTTIYTSAGDRQMISRIAKHQEKLSGGRFSVSAVIRLALESLIIQIDEPR